MAENYYRLVCFVVNVCSEPLRELFLKHAKSEAGISFTTLDAYLVTRKKAINHLYYKKKIRDDQYDSIYPSSGTADEKKWDVTLLVTLIMELCSLQALEITFINEIREIRNKLQHLPNTANLSDTEYEDYWQRLETATLFIAKQVGGTSYENEIAGRINNSKILNFPYLVESLRAWYEENKKQMAKKMEEMKETMAEMKTEMEEMKRKLEETNCSSKETLSTLHKVTATKKGPSGVAVKRMKAVDAILSRLRDNYARTKQLELREDFSNPPEIGEICTHLREKHHVVVTGNGRYLEAALAAVSGMVYISERCVEMSFSSDWRHIDPDEVDFVLCRDPFGSSCYDEQKAKSMADILSNMLLTTKEGVEAQRIDIVIVTDFSILNEFKQHYENELLDDVVNVFESTTENCPADLTLDCERHESSFSKASWPNNLKHMTELLFSKHAGCLDLVDPEKLQLAKAKFNEHKMVVISGPRKSGKTSLAVKLITSSCLESQSRLLYSPNDIRCIDFKSPCLIIIEEFAGRYRYEIDGIYKWFKAFDVLYDAVKAGKIKVIITSEKGKLEKCCKEIAQHSLLKHQVDLSDIVIFVKEELTENIATGSGETISPMFGGFTTRMKTEDITLMHRGLTAAESSDRQTVHDRSSSFLISNSRLEMSNGFPFLMGLSGLSPERNMRLSMNAVAPSYTDTYNDDLSFTYRGTHEETRRMQTDEMYQLSQAEPAFQLVGEKRIYCIRTADDIFGCTISGMCQLPNGDILLTDNVNNSVKKLDYRYRVSVVCGLSDGPLAVCFIGYSIYKAVVSIRKHLLFLNVTTMKVTRSIETDSTYTGLAYHDDKLYAKDDDNIYLLNTEGVIQGFLFPSSSDLARSYCIAVSDDGSKIYSLNHKGLNTLDSSGNLLHTIEDPQYRFCKCLCLDSNGHVILIEKKSREIIQIDSDGKQKLRTKALKYVRLKRNPVIIFDRETSELVCAGTSDSITVLQVL